MTLPVPARRGAPLPAEGGSWRGVRDRTLPLLTGATALLVVLVLLLFLGGVLRDGLRHFSWEFFIGYASRFPERAGIRAPLLGSVWILAFTGVFSIPLSVGAAVYFEEYASRNWLLGALREGIANLARAPSVLMGLVGLALFVHGFQMGRSVMAGALTLSLLVIPLVVESTREALREVPGELREGAYALGASRWGVLRHVVLPLAFPGIVGGGLRALARALGEAAPLVMIGVLAFIAFTPESPADPFTVLPLQIYTWVSRPQEEFRGLAAAAIIVLLALIFSLNALAAVLEKRLRARP